MKTFLAMLAFNWVISITRHVIALAELTVRICKAPSRSTVNISAIDWRGGGKSQSLPFKSIRPFLVSNDLLPFEDHAHFRVIQHGCSPDQLWPPEVVIARVPATLLFPLMTKKELLGAALIHKVKVGKQWKKSQIDELLAGHDCSGRECAHIISAFRYISSGAAKVVINPHGVNTASQFIDSGETKKFPPDPLPRSVEHQILTDVANAFSPALIEETGCRVCGQLKLVAQMELASDVSFDESLLVNTNATRKERYSQADAIEPVPGPVVVPSCSKICVDCVTSLRKNETPRLALCNGFWVGEIPNALQDLSFAEKTMIARIRHNKCVVRVASGRGKLSANAVMFENPVAKVYARLPPTKDELSEVLSFIFVGIAKPTEEDFKRSNMLVRRDKVRGALEWLKLNHKDYANVEIAYDNLETYPLKDVPVYVEWQRVTTDAETENPLTKSVFDTEDDTEGTMDGACTFRVHGLTGDQYEKASVAELKMKALAHLHTGGKSLAIGHAATPQSIWKNPQAYPGMFPWLYPYGYGGFGNSAICIKKFGEEQHKRNLLFYCDKRFQTDLYFPLVAFNHNQIKDSRVGASLLARRGHFDKITERLKTVNTTKLTELADRMKEGEVLGLYNVENEDDRKCFQLLEDLDLVGGHVEGSVTAKKYMRNEIWSLVNHLGAPTWYVTFSPVDVKHPLCLYYAGTEVDFSPAILPADERNRRIAANPVAAARFFHFMVNLFIKHILGVGSGHEGVYGDTAAYYGTVEQQGRLTLHLHSMIWVKNAPSPQELREKLLSDDPGSFRNELVAYLESCHQGHLFTGTVEEIKEKLRPYRSRERPRNIHDLIDLDESMEIDVDQEYKDPVQCLPERPPPYCEGHDKEVCSKCAEYQRWHGHMQEVVDDILIRSNIHSHTESSEMRKRKNLKTTNQSAGKGCLNEAGVCTARFPRDIVPETVVLPKDGSVVMKHLEPWLNNVTTLVTYLLGCNSDTSCILSGTALQAVIIYVADYITKAPLRSHHILKIMARILHEKRQSGEFDPTNATDENCQKLIMQIVNALSSKLEIGSPMAVQYLLGHPDHYTSHTFRVVWWRNYVSYIRAVWGIESAEKERVLLHKVDDDYVPHSNVDDYRYRPDEYSDVCLFKWLQYSAKKFIPKKDRSNIDAFKLQPGWLRFKSGHNQIQNYLVRYVEDQDDMTVLNFVGGALPRHDRGDREFYCCTMMTLFMPWREGTDLKSDDQSWDDAFNAHIFDDWQNKKMKNFNIRYECYDAKDDFHRQVKKLTKAAQALQKGTNGSEDDSDSEDEIYENLVGEAIYEHEEETLGYRAQRRQNAMLEAEQIMRTAGWLNESNTPVQCQTERVSLLEDVAPGEWDSRVAKTRAGVVERRVRSYQQNASQRQKSIHPNNVNRVEVVDTATVLNPKHKTESAQADDSENKIIAKWSLNQKQEQAFRTIARHARQSHKDGEPLGMFLTGMGGTGKSQIIKSLVEFFESRGESHRFILLAPTGSAAAILGGSTYHWAFGIRGGDAVVSGSDASNIRKMQTNLAGVEYIFIDEVSMISCRDMYRISAKLSKALLEPNKPFGGMNMIFAGDFGQLPPVKAKALYHPVESIISPRMKLSTQEECIGKAVWNQITTVIILTENMRQRSQTAEDAIFRRVLENLRYASCTKEDLEFLKSRTIGPGPNRPKLTDPRFRDVAIITPWNAQKDKINELGVLRFAKDTGQDIHYFYSIDTLPEDPSHGKKRRGKPDVAARRLGLSMKEKLWEADPSLTEHLAGRLAICIGMPIMIRHNNATELCITKGQDGVVCGWESSAGPDGKRVLDVLFIQLKDTPKNVNIPGLPTNVIPMTRASRKVVCQLPNDSTITVVRQQIEVLPFFAMTIHASQGKTRKNNVMDLNQKLSHFHYYTALSRGTSAEGTLLIQAFDTDKVTKGISGYLRQELRELQELDEIARLRYEGKLPPSVRGNHRRALLNSYRKVYGTQTDDDDDQAVDIKVTVLTDKDMKQYQKNQPEASTASLKPQSHPNHETHGSQQVIRVIAHDGITRKRQMHYSGNTPITKKPRTSVVERTKALGPTRVGSKWDSSDYSCAYDSMFSILWNLWHDTPALRGLLHNSGTILVELDRFFDRIRVSGTWPLEEARDEMRKLLNAENPMQFPYGPAMTSIVALRDRLFDRPTVGARYRWCSICNYIVWGDARPVLGALTVTRLHHVQHRVTNLYDWILAASQWVGEELCENCTTHGQPCLLNQGYSFSWIPDLLCFTLADETVTPSDRIVFRMTDRSTRQYRNNQAWYHDGMTSSNMFIERDRSRDLRICKVGNRRAVQALYVFEQL